MQNLFTNMFPLDGKLKLSVAGVSENERKKMVSTSQKISFHKQEQGYFSNIGFSLVEKKCPNKRILFQVDRKLVYTSRNEEFV